MPASTKSSSINHRNHSGVPPKSKHYNTMYTERSQKKNIMHTLYQSGIFIQILEIKKNDPVNQIEELTAKLTNKLNKAIQEEERKENMRDKEMNRASKKEKKNLEVKFNIERAKASKKIMKITE